MSPPVQVDHGAAIAAAGRLLASLARWAHPNVDALVLVLDLTIDLLRNIREEAASGRLVWRT